MPPGGEQHVRRLAGDANGTGASSHAKSSSPIARLLANRLVAGRSLPQWQIEVTAGGRIWYAIDVERREVRITYASPRHPKATD